MQGNQVKKLDAFIYSVTNSNEEVVSWNKNRKLQIF